MRGAAFPRARIDPMESPFRGPAEKVEDDAPVSEDAPPPPAHALVDATAGATAILPRNFTVTSDERVRGLVAGPPAYLRRRRRIEDLTAEVQSQLAQLDRGEAREPEALESTLVASVALLNRIIAAHNRYYPIEANLATDVHTGQYVELGEPWVPMPEVTLESLRRAPTSGASR